MKVNEGVVDRLVSRGIDTIFGIPGKQSLPLNETIGERDDIRFVVARHETAVSHQAWGYAEASGRPAATVVIPGPGDMNAMNGLKNALNDCTPLVHVAIETDPALRGGDAIHETPPETYDTVVKENLLVKNPGGASAAIDRAVTIATTPPMGPVRVGIPKTFLSMDVPLAEPGAHIAQPPVEPPAGAVEEATTLLTDAERPVVIAGGGVRSAGASAALQRLAERLGAPVVTTYKGKGVLPEDHQLSAGVVAGSAPPELLECLATADVALAVGTDFDAVAFRGWSVELPDRLVHVTLDASDIGTGYETTVGIVADARETLLAIDETLDEAGVERSPSDRAQAIRMAMDEHVASLVGETPPLSSVQALRTVREALPRETVVAVDAGGFRVWGLNTFAAYGPRRYVNPGSWATMGSGLPSAIGAQLANPDTPVVALTGDGGLLMCVHELHTAVSEELPLTVVVFNNSDYAIISEEAERSYSMGEQAYGWGETPVSFTTVAEGMGMAATRAETPAEIRGALETALASEEPTLVEVPTDPIEPQASEFMRG